MNSYLIATLLLMKLLTVLQFLAFARGSGMIDADLPEELQKGATILYLRDYLPKSFSNFPDAEFKLIDQFLRKVLSSRRNIRDITNESPWILVDTQSGALHQEKRIDREELCRNAAECYIVIKVFIKSVSETGFRDVQKIHLHIKDINDNSPVFPHPSIDVSVSETSSVNHEIDLDKYQAVDLDHGKNSSITYSLLPPSNYFEIQKFFDRNNNSHLRLVVTKLLDFEQIKIHRLTLKASDGGFPPRSTEVRVRIAVKDENDNAPVFDKKRYEVDLQEDTNLNEVVEVVHASDGDRGRNGAIRYFIRVNHNDDKTNEPGFVRCPVIVNNQTGAVILRDKLNHKLHNGYKVIVEAEDGNEINPQRGKTLLVFTVKDVNDNYPEITVTFIVYSEGNTGYVNEDAPIGTLLAFVTASDADDGMNSDVTVSVETILPSVQSGLGNFTAYVSNGKIMTGVSQVTRERILVDTPEKVARHFRHTEIGKFEINEDNLLVTDIQFDREKRKEYDVIIKAWDRGVPPKVSTTIIKIVILDVNEHSPIFQHPNLNITLPEDQKVGSVVSIANATDQDAANGPSWRQSSNDGIEKSLNGKVTYGLTLAVIDDESENLKKPVAISPETGKITLVRSLDYESKQSWKLIVTARDDGRPMTLLSTCNLEINVKNVNDNEPTFVNPPFNDSMIYASTTAQSRVFITLKALDFGLNEQTDLRYSFQIIEKDNEAVNNVNSLFELNRATGRFSLSADHATASLLGRYKTKISVTDSGNPPQSTSMILHVIVIDEPIPLHLQGILNRKNDDDGPINHMILIAGAGVGGLIIVVIIIIITAIIIRKKRRLKDDCEIKNKKTRQVPPISHLSEESIALTPHSKCDSQQSLNQDGESESKYDTSSTRRSSTGKYQYCEAPNASLDRRSFIQVNPTETQTPVKKSRSMLLDASKRTINKGQPNSDFNDGYDCETIERNGMTDLGKQCTKMCRVLGHSDACWMPVRNDPISYPDQLCSPAEYENDSARKDSGCSVDSSSSNISYYKLNKSDQKRSNDVFLSGDAPPLPDLIEKPRTLVLSDGGSLISSNASTGGSRPSNILPSSKATSPRRKKSSSRSIDSRGDFLSVARRGSLPANRSTRC